MKFKNRKKKNDSEDWNLSPKHLDNENNGWITFVFNISQQYAFQL